MTKGSKISEATRAKMRKAAKARAAKMRAELKRLGLKTSDYYSLPVVPIKPTPFPDSIMNAIEFGYVCCEKNLSLSATMNTAFEMVLDKVKEL